MNAAVKAWLFAERAMTNGESGGGKTSLEEKVEKPSQWGHWIRDIKEWKKIMLKAVEQTATTPSPSCWKQLPRKHDTMLRRGLFVMGRIRWIEGKGCGRRMSLAGPASRVETRRGACCWVVPLASADKRRAFSRQPQTGACSSWLDSWLRPRERTGHDWGVGWLSTFQVKPRLSGSAHGQSVAGKAPRDPRPSWVGREVQRSRLGLSKSGVISALRCIMSSGVWVR